MWCPKPKPKVIARPTPIFGQGQGQHARKDLVWNDSEEQQQQHHADPHRDTRHYGMRHTDVTRIFLVEDRSCHVPDQPYGLKKTDITRYLERVAPSHAFQPSRSTGQRQPTTTSTPRNTNTHPYKKEKEMAMGDFRGAYPARPPSRWETRESRSKLEASRENLRPDTAPTGEMKRLSASNAASTVNFCSKPSTAASSRRAMTSSPLKPVEGPGAIVAAPLRHASRPWSTQTSEPGGGARGGLQYPSADSGFKDSKVGCAPDGPGSRMMTASSHTSSCARLQTVPE